METAGKLDGASSHNISNEPFEPFHFDNEVGQFIAIEYPGITTFLLSRADFTSSVAVSIYSPEVGLAPTIQLTSDAARGLASSLNHLADLVDDPVASAAAMAL